MNWSDRSNHNRPNKIVFALNDCFPIIAELSRLSRLGRCERFVGNEALASPCRIASRTVTLRIILPLISFVCTRTLLILTWINGFIPLSNYLYISVIFPKGIVQLSWLASKEFRVAKFSIWFEWEIKSFDR